MYTGRVESRTRGERRGRFGGDSTVPGGVKCVCCGDHLSNMIDDAVR